MRKKHHKILTLTTFLSLIPYTVLAAPLKKVTCGDSNQGLVDDYAIPAKIPELTHYIVNIIQVAVPVVLVILGMIDLVKATTAGKEDEIKKAQGVIIKRLIAGALVFFIFAIVKLLISIVDKNASGIIDCMNCFINNSCKTL